MMRIHSDSKKDTLANVEKDIKDKIPGDLLSLDIRRCLQIPISRLGNKFRG